MKRISFTVTAAVFALAGGALAYAAEGQPNDPMGGMKQITTRAEAKAHAETFFGKLDANRDGKLDKTDRVARRDAFFDTMDANHDGNLSRNEFGTPPPRPNFGDGARRGGGMKQRHDMHMMGIMGLADPTRSGTVSKDGFVGAALKIFDAADANHDGKLTPEERKAARASMRDKMGGMRGRHHRMKMGDMDMPPPPSAP